jgi:hypothetical protein
MNIDNTAWRHSFFIPFSMRHLYHNASYGKIEPVYLEWLLTNLGPAKNIANSNGRYFIAIQNGKDKQGDEIWGREVCFRDPQDAMLFKLTWL